ncbi:MAG: hypothetical protein Q8N21_00790 [bacterium]|nr:hypothetical protein [bacterium]
MMKLKINSLKIFTVILTVGITCAGVYFIARAGDLNPVAAPGDTMKTLDDIYCKIANCTPVTYGLDSLASAASTMRTLQEIYDIAFGNYYGKGWQANSSGNGSVALTQANCEAAYLVDNYRWQWFEDGNGDGDTTDPEDGICVLMCTGVGCVNTANFSNDAYAAALSWNGAEQVNVNELYDNTFIGDWTCAGTFATGTVAWGSYPTSAQVGAGSIALATTDCLDGKRDLLPVVNESSSDSRIVSSGTATAGGATTLTDSAATWPVNGWNTQKVKIFAGTAAGSVGTISSNTATVLTVAAWSPAVSPDNTSQYGVIYIKPNDSTADAFIGYNGPVTPEVLSNWKGTRLPASKDFFGFCGDGTNKKYIGSYGIQAGRTGEFLNEANDLVYEWLSEQHGNSTARIAGPYACSYFYGDGVGVGYRFRAVFRP